MPWRNADKRIVFWLAKEHSILNDMLKLTRSCEGDQWNTENFTKECGECWWCLERNWAKTYYPPSDNSNWFKKNIWIKIDND
jgi:7-cyano-7-deazaguanine synthase in queuosine biosynthesis